MSFALVAYLLVGGQLNAYVVDDGLSYQECREAVAIGMPFTVDNGGQVIDLTDAALVCEVEYEA